MIESKDRSGYIGASDTDKVVGNWNTATFEKWWLQKIGINRYSFNNKYVAAGGQYEHRILESLGIPMELDKQVIIEDILLRVNLDGNTEDTIYECKTYRLCNGFKLPKKYVQQVQVQMYATGFRKAKIVVYGLEEGDYDNYFHEIDQRRLQVFDIEYDEKWVNEVYLPRLRVLAECLEEGRFPNAGNR
jgi:hypothetical protein